MMLMHIYMTIQANRKKWKEDKNLFQISQDLCSITYNRTLEILSVFINKTEIVLKKDSNSYSTILSDPERNIIIKLIHMISCEIKK